MAKRRASEMVEVARHGGGGPIDFLETLRRAGGYYECPQDSEGTCLGPLVGYAGKYDDEHHFVGKTFYNCAKIEEFPHVGSDMADELHGLLDKAEVPCSYLLAAPMGGLAVGELVALYHDVRYGFPEKKITALATSGSREESELVFSRHEIEPGEDVVVFEDVCNNFSTTAKLQALIESVGAKMTAVACLLNRSEATTWNGLPVISLAHIPTMQYRQDDPCVASEIARGNIVWKPKSNWQQLMAAMNANI